MLHESTSPAMLTVGRAEGLALAGFIAGTVDTDEGRGILSAIGAVMPADADPEGLVLRAAGVTIARQFIDATRSSATVLLTVHQLALLYQYVAVWIDGAPIEAAASAPGARSPGSCMACWRANGSTAHRLGRVDRPPARRQKPATASASPGPRRPRSTARRRPSPGFAGELIPDECRGERRARQAAGLPLDRFAARLLLVEAIVPDGGQSTAPRIVSRPSTRPGSNLAITLRSLRAMPLHVAARLVSSLDAKARWSLRDEAIRDRRRQLYAALPVTRAAMAIADELAAAAEIGAAGADRDVTFILLLNSGRKLGWRQVTNILTGSPDFRGW